MNRLGGKAGFKVLTLKAIGLSEIRRFVGVPFQFLTSSLLSISFSAMSFVFLFAVLYL